MQNKIQSAPTIFYPESDGKPMAETEIHRDLMIDFIQTLQDYYINEDVCVSGNMFMYYEEGNPRKSVAPDVFVVCGIEKKQRRIYRIWEEGQPPDFILEVASPSTFNDDIGPKKDLYESVLKVKEYFIYDPLGQVVPSFIGYRLIDGVYQEIDFVEERLRSNVLGLELGEYMGELRLYEPTLSYWLKSRIERIEDAETRVQIETTARQVAEKRLDNAEQALAEALAEIERLNKD
ncbi:Uma2 family endonuclease [Candidatus Poribacteria bacterium]|nr:Uma2 family endonuclease [Candidatus Poribacteria bacterium]